MEYELNKTVYTQKRADAVGVVVRAYVTHADGPALRVGYLQLLRSEGDKT
jgi:hypothetical protein